MKLLIKLGLVMSILLLGACGGGGGSSSSGCSVLNAKIFGGEQCNQSARSPVLALVAVATDGEVYAPAGTCTGALVTIDDFITSAHCFTDPIIAAERAGVEIAGFAVVVGGTEGELMRVVNAQVHPLYNGQIGSQFDLAMATLQSVPNPPIGPLPILLSEATGPGSKITAFGYGTNERGEIGELKAADFSVDRLIAGNLFVIGDGDESICPGDSGGPAVYVTSDGVSTIAGVNSFGFGDCRPVASVAFGFVDLQFEPVITFIGEYAPDAISG